MALRTLYQTLLDSDIARLRVIGQQWEITLAAERRTDLAAELADAMACAEAVDSAWRKLPDAERAALEDLLRHGGALPWASFTRRWGQVRAVGPGRLEREALWRDPISPAEGLWYWGFLQRAFEERDNRQVELAFVPEGLKLYLPTPPPPNIPPPEPLTPPLHQVPGDDALCDVLVSWLSALQIEDVDRLSDGGLDVSVRDALLRRIPEPAEVRLALLRTLALEKGWVRLDEQGVLRPVPEPVLAWLQADVWEQWAMLAQAWMDSERLNDLAQVPTLQPDPIVGWPYAPQLTRQRFLDVLRFCVPGVWYGLSDFVSYTRENATDFLREDGDYDAWAPRDALTGAALRGFDSWDAVEGELVLYYLLGPLTWLGGVDIGYAMVGLPPSAFRLNDAGAALLGLADPPTFDAKPPARLRRNGLVLVPARRRYERFQLSRVAQVVQSDKAYGFRLTPASLARARQQRISSKRIISFLEQATGQALPDYLRTAIKYGYDRGEVARLERVWVLRVHDPTVLDLPALRQFIQETLGPGAALVRVEDRDRVLAILTREGILAEFKEKA